MKSAKNILIHSFVTDGYMEYAEIFLQSLHALYGNKIHVRIDGCNLSDNDVYRLRSLYNNISIYNNALDINNLSEILEVNTDTVLSWKKEIESNRTTIKNFWFKVFISVDQRYRSMDKVIGYAKSRGYDILLHLDIDNYFRSNFLENLVEVLGRHDLGVYVNSSSEHTKKYWGGFLCFNLNGNIERFVQIWMSEIDRYYFRDRWKGFGQSVLSFAIDSCDDLKVVNLSAAEKSPVRSDSFDAKADIWQASNSRRHFLPSFLHKIPQILFNLFFNKLYLGLLNRDTLPYVSQKAKISRKICMFDLKHNTNKS